MKKIRTGIFGGSFNPVHIGHTALANYICESGAVDELWFMVTPRNPLKESSTLWDDQLRLKLTRLAAEDYPKFHVSDYEFHLPRPNYMSHTLTRLTKEHPQREFILIIGADNWQIFHKWHDHEGILNRHKILIYPRKEHTVDPSTLPANVKLINTPIIEISSTFIRKSLDEDKDIRYYVHPKVWKEIKRTRKCPKK